MSALTSPLDTELMARATRLLLILFTQALPAVVSMEEFLH